MMPYSHRSMHAGGCGPRHWSAPARQCRKESKELLVQPSDTNQTGQGTTTSTGIGVNEPAGKISKTAIIGGGCCVQLSVEFMPAQPSPAAGTQCEVIVEVMDSEHCRMLWGKTFTEGYHVKECIITTYPGAQLVVAVSNAIARVRWCEIFSC